MLQEDQSNVAFRFANARKLSIPAGYLSESSQYNVNTSFLEGIRYRVCSQVYNSISQDRSQNMAGHTALQLVRLDEPPSFPNLIVACFRYGYK